MNTLSSLFKWIGNTIGADPSTMATTSKTVVGAINDLSQQMIKVAVIQASMTAPVGAAAQNVSLSDFTSAVPASATVLCATPIASPSPAFVSVNGTYQSKNHSVEVGSYNHYSQALSGPVTILVLYTA